MIKTWRFEQTVGLRNRRDGQKIFQKEKITLKEQGQSIDACVADSGSEHSVKLNFIVRSGLKAYCDCGRRELCEHVWATLLSCEKQALLKVAGGGPFSLRFDPQANDDDDDDDSLYIDEGPFVQTQKSLLKSRCPDLPPELLNEFALKLAHGDLSFSSLESILLENSAVYRRAGMKKWRDKSVSDYQFFVKSVCSELFAKTFFEIIKKSNKHEALEDLRETALENFEESIGGLDELQLNYDDEITLGSARENAVAVDEFDFAIPAKNVFVFTEEKKYKLKKVQRAKFELYVNFFENEHDQLSIDFSFLLNDEKFNKEEIFYLCKTGALVKGDWYVMSFVKILPLLETLDLLEDATFFEEDVEAMAQSLAHYPCEVKFSLKGVEQSFVKKPFVKNIELSGATKLSILPSFIYGEMTFNPFIYPYQPIEDEDSKFMNFRDFKSELTAFQELSTWDKCKIEKTSLKFHRKDFYETVSSMLATGWNVCYDGQDLVNPSTKDLNLLSEIDWFEIDGHVTWGEERFELPDLLKSMTANGGMITLPDGRVGIIPPEFVHLHERLSSLGKIKNGKLIFSRTQALLIDALLSEKDILNSDKEYKNVCQSILKLKKNGKKSAPKSFQGQLREYQKQGLKWMTLLKENKFGGILADDMGLGKTIQVLSLLEAIRKSSKKQSPSVVIAPTSLIYNWQSEAKKFTPDMTVLLHYGTNRDKSLKSFAKADLIVTTYGMMRSDIAQFSEMEFNYCILDEAQAIKNHSTSVSKVVRLMKAQNRLCLSGTPVENHLGDLWSQIEFLNPGLLGSATAFKKISKNLASDNKSLQAFAKALSPFILRRTKKEVLTELPDKTEQIIYCEMKAPQKKLYDELLENYQKNILGEVNDAGEVGGKGFQVLEALTRLRQTACHPGLIDDKYGPEYSSKIHNLMPLVKETLEEGHKCLIFSQYTSFLKKVRDEFDKEEIMYEYLDGQTPSKKRAEKVKKFQTNDKCKIFLISLKAGGTGLNLTAAQTVFILDPWWNPAAESQAIDRAHRMGQKNKVMAYRLVTHGTVEERVIELQEKKRQLSDAVLSGGASLGNLSLDDLNYLFGATGK